MQRNHRISEIYREFDERFMFHTEQDSGIMFVNVKNMGGHYAGENYGSADIALQYGGPGGSWSNWNADDKPHLQKNAEKYRKQNHRREKHPRNRQQPADQPEGKMAEALENTGQASSQNESAGVVSGTFVHCDPWLCHLFSQTLRIEEGLPLTYLYVGATVPVTLLLLRQALDFSYKEELVMDTLTDYVEQMRSWAEEIPAAKKRTPFYRKKLWTRLPAASSRQLLPEVISVRC